MNSYHLFIGDIAIVLLLFQYIILVTLLLSLWLAASPDLSKSSSSQEILGTQYKHDPKKRTKKKFSRKQTMEFVAFLVGV